MCKKSFLTIVQGKKSFNCSLVYLPETFGYTSQSEKLGRECQLQCARNFLSHFCKKTSTAFLSILHKLEPFRCYKFHNLKNLTERVSLAFSLREIVSQICAGQESFNCLVVHRPEPFCYLKNLAESFTLRGAQFLPGAERCTVRRQLLRCSW